MTLPASPAAAGQPAGKARTRVLVVSDTQGGGLTVTLGLPAAPADPAVLAADGPAGRPAIPYQF